MPFPLLTIYTLTYFALMVYDFVAKQAFDVPSGLMAVYIALVVAYAGDKEIRRWVGKELPSRKGAIFVYLWFLFYLAAFVIYSFKPEYLLPKDLSMVALQVLGVFFGSKASKKIYEVKQGRPSTEPKTNGADLSPHPDPLPQGKRENPVGDPEKAILDLLKQKGRAKREELLSTTSLSRSSLGRLLDDMEQRQLITQVGELKASYYELKRS